MAKPNASWKVPTVPKPPVHNHSAAASHLDRHLPIKTNVSNPVFVAAKRSFRFRPTAVISSDYEYRTHLPIIWLVFHIKRQLATACQLRSFQSCT